MKTKVLRKLLSVLLAVSMLSTGTFIAKADNDFTGEDENTFFDDFSWATDTDDSMAALQAGEAIKTINEETKNNLFYVVSRSINMPSLKWWVQDGVLYGTTTQGLAQGGRYTALIVKKDCMPDLGTSFTVSADMYKFTTNQTVFGLEFAITKDDMNQGTYYFLCFDMSSNNILLQRYVDGKAETVLSMPFQNNTNRWAIAYGKNRPFTFTATITQRGKQNIIDCNVMGVSSTGRPLLVAEGTYVDSSDKAIDISNVIAPLGFQLRSQDNMVFCFDNVRVTKEDASEQIYRDVFCKSEDVTEEFDVEGSERVYKLDDAYKVEKVSLEDYFDSIFISEDGTEFEEIDTTSQYADINTGKKYQYIKVPKAPEGNLYVFVPAANTITVSKGEKIPLAFYNRNGLFTDIELTSENETVLGILQNTLLAKKPATIKVTCAGTYSVQDITIIIEGEFDKAIHAMDNGDLSQMNQFLKKEQQAFDLLNCGIQEKNAEKIIEALTGNGDNTLSTSEIFDNEKFVKMSAEDLSSMAEKLMTYPGDFNCICEKLPADVSKIKEPFESIYKTLLKESKAIKLDSVSSAEEMAAVLTEINDVLALPIDDECFKACEKDIENELINKEFKNSSDFEELFYKTLIIKNVENSINDTYLLNLIEKYADYIGYDKSKYEKISDKKAFGNSFIAKKSQFKDIDDIKNYIDNYKEEKPEPSPTPKPVRGGGSSGGGGGSISVPSKIIVPEYFEKEPTAEPVKAQLFSDVETSHWAYDAIAFMKARNVVGGYEDGSFKPNSSVTRAEFIKMMMTAFKVDTETTNDAENPYSDADASAWYYGSMLKATELGIVGGDGGKCYPDRCITREELCALIYRMTESLGKTLNRNYEIVKFDDEETISDWAKVSVLKLQTAGIINGIDGKFEPKSNATRAMAAQILYKSVKGMEKEAEINE